MLYRIIGVKVRILHVNVTLLCRHGVSHVLFWPRYVPLAQLNVSRIHDCIDTPQKVDPVSRWFRVL